MLSGLKIQHDALIISNGTSLTQEQVDFCKGKLKTYVVNNAHQLAPWADVLYAADAKWWDRYQPEFAGEKWTASKEAADKHNINFIQHSDEISWSITPGLIAGGGNSGHQALNLAYLQGARKIYLLGFDHNHPTQHWFGTYPEGFSDRSSIIYWTGQMIKASKQFTDLQVINCSPKSMIPCFPKMSIFEALQ